MLDAVQLIKNTRVLTSQSLTSTFQSAAIDLSSLTGYSIQLIFSSGATGTLLVTASNDGTNFDSTSPILSVALAGTAGNRQQNNQFAHYKYIRIEYTASSGTGTLNAYVCGKTLG